MTASSETIVSVSYEITGSDDPAVIFLLDMLQSEYVGMYGEPDPNPDPDADLTGEFTGAIVLALLDEETPVGVVAWKESADRPGVAIMHRLYVHYRHRRSRISHQLLNVLEHSARDAGMRRMELETGMRQTPALTLYKSAGYVHSEPFGYYAQFAGISSVFLGKDL